MNVMQLDAKSPADYTKFLYIIHITMCDEYYKEFLGTAVEEEAEEDADLMLGIELLRETYRERKREDPAVA